MRFGRDSHPVACIEQHLCSALVLVMNLGRQRNRHDWTIGFMQTDIPLVSDRKLLADAMFEEPDLAVGMLG